MKTFRSLGRDESGATIVELALILPIMAGMLVGASDLAQAYSAKLELEQAAQRGIERVMQQRSVETDYSDLTPEVATAAGVAESAVTVTQWLECNDVQQAADVTQCPNDTDIYARYVSVSVTDTYTPAFGSTYLGANADGTYTLTGSAGIRLQ